MSAGPGVLKGRAEQFGDGAVDDDLVGAGIEVLLQPFEVLAGLQFALINSRLADLLISSGASAESVASEYVTWATDTTKRSLDRLAGR